MVGLALNHYRIAGALGHGGMGAVYAAEDTKLHRRVALKVLPAAVSADRERRQRFEREAQAIASLNHPNIVTVYSVEQAGDVHFLTMELVEGQTLAELIPQDGVPLARLLQLAIPLADAVSAAHQRGIVHRDLKPLNVMVTPEGRVKVLDFGLAKVKEAVAVDVGATSLPTQELTEDGRILGTVAYMSPEQAEGRAVDHRSDIFSLGVMLYELATGERPFKGDTNVSLLSSILRDTPPSVTDLRAVLPRELGRIVRRCLVKDPARRYQTALDVRNELEELKQALDSGELTAAGVAGAQRPTTRAPAAVPVKSVAVLPLANLSPDPENEYFADGITEEIINALAQLKDLRVAARTSSFAFKGRSADLADVGEKLKVATVVEGSVRKAGNRLRITAQLVNVADGYHLWSERYDRELDDVFAVQDEIATAIAKRLEVTLGSAIDEPLVKAPTENLEAYQVYLKGRHLWNKRGAGLRAGLELFEQALRLDPDYALAHAGVADAYTLLAFYSFMRPADAMPRAKTAAQRAVALAPGLAEAHAALAWISLTYDWDWRAAASGFRRALDLNPNLVAAHYWRSAYLWGIECRFDEAIAEARHATDLDPLAPHPVVQLGLSLLVARRHDEAILALRRAAELDATSFLAHYYLGIAYRSRNMLAEAIAALETAASLSGRHPWPVAGLCIAYAAAGRSTDAQALHDELAARSRREYVQPSGFAALYAQLGRIGEAFEYLERAVAERDPLVVAMNVWPDLDPLRDDPRYHAIVRAVGWPEGSAS